jgi:transposase
LSKLDIWIDGAVNSGLVGIVRLARVLRRGVGAVRDAIKLPWSNGQAEGQINRLRRSSAQCIAEHASNSLGGRMLPLNQPHHHTN